MSVFLGVCCQQLPVYHLCVLQCSFNNYVCVIMTSLLWLPHLRAIHSAISVYQSRYIEQVLFQFYALYISSMLGANQRWLKKSYTNQFWLPIFHSQSRITSFCINTTLNGKVFTHSLSGRFCKVDGTHGLLVKFPSFCLQVLFL